MSPIEEQIESLDLALRVEFERIRRIVKSVVPEVTEGVSYAMPAYLYKGKGLLSVMPCKKHIGMYPFSGKTLVALADKLTAYEQTTGSIHFQLSSILPEPLLKDLLLTRKAEIDAKRPT